jgi:prophage regulatory protein
MQKNNESNHDRLLRFPEVRKICGLSRSSIWRLQQKGDFPSPRKISARACGWLLSEIASWLDKKTKSQNKNINDTL